MVVDDRGGVESSDGQTHNREIPNRERDVTTARETDIFLEVSLRRLAIVTPVPAASSRRTSDQGPNPDE